MKGKFDHSDPLCVEGAFLTNFQDNASDFVDIDVRGDIPMYNLHRPERLSWTRFSVYDELGSKRVLGRLGKLDIQACDYQYACRQEEFQ